uniref:Orn_Arg_deC_N domain-containing protein n=1 Tax=Strongyloides venezuelensis TaxID=75913 RepID=A0A0K0FQV1_STRVS
MYIVNDLSDQAGLLCYHKYSFDNFVVFSLADFNSPDECFVKIFLNKSCASYGDLQALVQRCNIPFIVESKRRIERICDIYSRLMEDRIILLIEPVNDHLSSVIRVKMLFLNCDYPSKPIYFYLYFSKSVTIGLRIYGCLKKLRLKIKEE